MYTFSLLRSELVRDSDTYAMTSINNWHQNS